MWWFGSIVSWREIIYFVILLAGSLWGLYRWLSVPKNKKELKYKKLSYGFIFLGFFMALLTFIFHLVGDVSAARAANIQGLTNAPPIPIWGSLRILEWSFLITGSVISFIFNIYGQRNIKINDDEVDENEN